MAVQGPFKVECGDLFPLGVCVVSEVTPAYEYIPENRDARVQTRDKDTGLPVWLVEVLDLDQQAREKTFKVKIASEYQPVPPEPISAQVPIRPVVLEGLQVMPYIKEVPNPQFGKMKDAPRTIPKQAYSLRCTGLAAPGAARRADTPKAA